MKDFQAKVIKVFLNSTTGLLCQTGLFMKEDDNFIVIKNLSNDKIQYIPLYSIKYIEILRKVEVEDYE